jgi:SAM-dependent methyltransferase
MIIAKYFAFIKQQYEIQHIAKKIQYFSTKNTTGQLSHSANPISENIAINEAQTRVNIKWKYLPLEKRDANQRLFNEVIKIPLIKYMIVNKGLNGYWTEYILNFHNILNFPVSPFEKKILEDLPLLKATQERDKIFQKVNQKLLKTGDSLAAIPCGLSRELLQLNYDNITGINLTAIDIDLEALTLSQSRANDILYKYNINGANINFITKLCDAWNLNYKKSFNLISSNGLTIYEKDDNKVSQLYARFYEALKPGGVLTTSFIASPNEWNMSKINMVALETQKILFTDIVEANFHVFRTTKSIITSLKSVGFKKTHIIPDSASIFPTVIATR